MVLEFNTKRVDGSWGTHSLVQRSEEIRQLTGVASLVAMAASPASEGQVLSAHQPMLERALSADWLQVVGVTGVQGYQTPGLGERR